MTSPSRRLPAVGQPVEVVTLGAREPAVITRVEGATVWVRASDGGDEHPFDLHRTTANFVARGEPYWGTRLRFDV